MVIANKKAENTFIIPVSWAVCDTVKVQANSLEEAFEFVRDNSEQIPLGTEPEYIDGTYTVSELEAEACSCYQGPALFCSHFECEDLEKYTDSMLFDSESCIASATFSRGFEETEIDLMVYGEVDVSYKGITYTTPSEFPPELRELISNNPDWENDENVVVSNNNWFEIVGDGGNGVIFEDNLSKTTPEQLLKKMTEVAYNAFGLEPPKEVV